MRLDAMTLMSRLVLKVEACHAWMQPFACAQLLRRHSGSLARYVERVSPSAMFRVAAF